MRAGSDPQAGETFGGRYRIERPLGAGSMGAVYAARELASGRPVALKVIAEEHTSDPQVLARFQREGRIMARVQHPNIVRILELDQADDRWFIAMELLEGRNLGVAMAATDRYAPSEVVPVLKGILDALEVAHEHQIVHRDIKPENVFLVGDGAAAEVKVLDFGVAKVVGMSPEEQLTRSGMVFGTPEFMAPEQATGTSVDHRSDLYAVACVGYAMLCGRPPFVDNWPLRVIMKQAFEPHVPPSRLRPDLPGAAGVDRFVARALEKKPADRYQAASEMRADLAMLLAP
jgi:serine/threonine-protein kinase